MVKITFKTVQNKVSLSPTGELVKRPRVDAMMQLFTIDAEQDDTVSHRTSSTSSSSDSPTATNSALTLTQVAGLKKKIHESQTFPVEQQKLIYSGQSASFRVADDLSSGMADAAQERFCRTQLQSRLSR